MTDMKHSFFNWLSNNQTSIISTIGIFILFLAYNHILILNPSTALTDWLDYPLIVFILEQNIKHLSQLDFANFANISSFYPSPGGMFFTEIMFIQGLLGTLLFPFTQNYILTHNIIFFLTALTNVISLQYFWSKVFKKQWIVSLLSLVFIFSPYYFSTYVHFQMVGYAFFFFSAGKVISATNTKDFFWAGILSGLQFLAGVYLGIYSLMFTGFFLLWKLWQTKKLTKILVWGSSYTVGFTLIAGYFVYMFAKIKNQYQIHRDAGFYVDLAMQPTDWLFNPYDSIWSRYIYEPINTLGKRSGPHYSPGWVLLLSSITGMYYAIKNKKKYLSVFIFLLLGWGIVASLGPRLTVNGHYYGTLLPYAVLLKFTPFFDALRATGRWFFITQIGLLFFVGIVFEKLQSKLTIKWLSVLIALGLLIYAIEIVPLTQRTQVQEYKSSAYQVLTEQCTQGDVLLEYPFGTVSPEYDVGYVLNYWVKILLNQMHHDCYIVNGYSGFDPKHYLDFKEAFQSALTDNDVETFSNLLTEKDVTFIKINKSYLAEEIPQTLGTFIKSENFQTIYESPDYLVVRKK